MRRRTEYDAPLRICYRHSGPGRRPRTRTHKGSLKIGRTDQYLHTCRRCWRSGRVHDRGLGSGQASSGESPRRQAACDELGQYNKRTAITRREAIRTLANATACRTGGLQSLKNARNRSFELIDTAHSLRTRPRLTPPKCFVTVTAAKVQESHGEAAPGREDTRQVRSARQTVPKHKENREKGRSPANSQPRTDAESRRSSAAGDHRLNPPPAETWLLRGGRHYTSGCPGAPEA
jgi:hypothetical protein